MRSEIMTILLASVIVIGATYYIDMSSKKFWVKTRETSWFKALPSLICAGLISILTIWLTPIVNQEFEKQKIRSEYIIDNLNNLKVDTLSLYRNISAFTKDEQKVHNIEEIKNDILKLRYRLLEIETVLINNEYTHDFKNALNCIDDNLDKDSIKLFYCNAQFVTASQNLSIYLAKETDVAIDSVSYTELVQEQ